MGGSLQSLFFDAPNPNNQHEVKVFSPTFNGADLTEEEDPLACSLMNYNHALCALRVDCTYTYDVFIGGRCIAVNPGGIRECALVGSAKTCMMSVQVEESGIVAGACSWDEQAGVCFVRPKDGEEENKAEGTAASSSVWNPVTVTLLVLVVFLMVMLLGAFGVIAWLLHSRRRAEQGPEEEEVEMGAKEDEEKEGNAAFLLPLPSSTSSTVSAPNHTSTDSVFENSPPGLLPVSPPAPSPAPASASASSSPPTLERVPSSAPGVSVDKTKKIKKKSSSYTTSSSSSSSSPSSSPPSLKKKNSSYKKKSLPQTQPQPQPQSQPQPQPQLQPQPQSQLRAQPQPQSPALGTGDPAGDEGDVWGDADAGLNERNPKTKAKGNKKKNAGKKSLTTPTKESNTSSSFVTSSYHSPTSTPAPAPVSPTDAPLDGRKVLVVDFK